MKELKLIQYASFKKQLLELGQDFSVKATSYTKQVKVGKKKYMFADKPTSFQQLKLINLSRTDGLKYLKKKKFKKIISKDIPFYQFNDIFEGNTIIKGYKIDLTSAYWVMAINEGIISKKTDDFFKECKLDKHARLKALGSYATKKHIQNYENGKMTLEKVEIWNEDLRQLYLYICEKVTEIMQVISNRFKTQSFYYYWDCLFFNDSVDPYKVQAHLKKLGFGSTVETTDFAVIKGKYLSKLIDINKKIEYPIKRTEVN